MIINHFLQKNLAVTDNSIIFAENKLHLGIALTPSNVVSSKLNVSALDLHYLCHPNYGLLKHSRHGKIS